MSLIIGVIDVCSVTAQENELASYSIVDIGAYIVLSLFWACITSFFFRAGWLSVLLYCGIEFSIVKGGCSASQGAFFYKE